MRYAIDVWLRRRLKLSGSNSNSYWLKKQKNMLVMVEAVTFLILIIWRHSLPRRTCNSRISGSTSIKLLFFISVKNGYTQNHRFWTYSIELSKTVLDKMDTVASRRFYSAWQTVAVTWLCLNEVLFKCIQQVVNHTNLLIDGLAVLRNVASPYAWQFCGVVSNPRGLETLMGCIDASFVNPTVSFEFFDFSEVFWELLCMFLFNSYLFSHKLCVIFGHLGLILHTYFAFFFGFIEISTSFCLHLPNSQI